MALDIDTKAAKVRSCFELALKQARPVGGPYQTLRVTFAAHPMLVVPGSVLNEYGEAAFNINRNRGARDTAVLQDGFTETLHVEGRWLQCFVPWSAVHWISNDETGACYYESAEIIAAKNAADSVPVTKSNQPDPSPYHFARMVKNEKARARGLKVIDGLGQSTAPVTGHLKIVRD